MASSLGLVFLAYVKMNTFAYWIFVIMHPSFLFLVFIFPKVTPGKSGNGSERVTAVQGILLGLFGDPQVIKAWFLWGDRHPRGHCDKC